MTINSAEVRLRDLNLPDDYIFIAQLFNSIESSSTTVEALEDEVT